MNKNKIHELNTISTENRLGRIAMLAEFAYLPIYLPVVLLKLVSFKMMPLTIFGTSLTIGLLGNIITEKKYKVKKRVARVSSAKNEREREEEIFKYELENEKLKNRNIALAAAVVTIDKETSLLNEVSKTGKYVIFSKNALNDKDKLEKEKEELEEKLEIRNKTLDELSTQNFVSNKKNKIHDWMDITMYTMMVGMVVGIANMLPLFANLNNPIPSSPLFHFVSIFGTMGIAMTTSVSVLNSKKKRQNNILKKYMKDGENLDVEKELTVTTVEISKMHLELQENKRKIEDIEKNADLATSTDFTQKNTGLKEDELDSVCGLATVFLNDKKDEMHPEIEGPTLVKRDRHKK